MRRERALLGIDDEEPTIECPVAHPREIDLGNVVIMVVPLGKIPAGPPEIDRRVKMGIERQQAFVQRCRIVGEGTADGGTGEQGGKCDFQSHWPCPTGRRYDL